MLKLLAEWTARYELKDTIVPRPDVDLLDLRRD